MMMELIGRAAMLEQLAEEASELAQAALKAARVYRRENPTPVTWEKAFTHLNEEYTDVRSCAKELGLIYDHVLEEQKIQRFADRWDEMRKPHERRTNLE